MKNPIFLFFLLILFPGFLYSQKSFILSSPDTKIKVNIVVSKTDIKYNIVHEDDLMLDFSQISMTLIDGKSFGINPKLSKSSTKSMNRIIDATIYKREKVKDNFNELLLQFKDGYDIVFRAYNDGVAYRFISNIKEPFIVENELAEFRFPSSQKAYIPYVRDNAQTLESQFSNPFENIYVNTSLSGWDKKRMAFTPLLVESVKGKKVCILEADLLDYPGMFLYNEGGSNTLKGVFAKYPKDIVQGGYISLQGIVKSREDYIAKFDGATAFPWRAIVISSDDRQLADNDMVYKLASPPSASEDFSWVKPGKVAWDWWNSWNLYGVDFKMGINTDTYKYYIDFASKYGIEYIIIDDGWSAKGDPDLMKVIPELDLPGLINYGKERNVGLILWAGYYPFDRDLEKVCKHYSEMGIKGFKVDYMERDDQPMVDFHRRAAEVAAKYKLLLNYHGTYKPTGLQRTYPNVINVEGVHGMEQLKWSEASVDQVTYDVTMPFIRMMAGPVDYTPGAMRNASKGNYRPVHSEPMSQGTRCRQLAEYIVFEAPLGMLCDSPSNYMSESECTEFIASIPTVWDNTIVLNGKVSEYITIARQKGAVWYIGGLTNWDRRSVELDLSFLGEGNYKAEIFRDGINANRSARDYKKEIINIPSSEKITIDMAPGGGFAARIYQ